MSWLSKDRQEVLHQIQHWNSPLRTLRRRTWSLLHQSFFVDRHLVKPPSIQTAIVKMYHYETLLAREQDPHAVVPLQPPKVPTEWKGALLLAEMPDSTEDDKRYHVINGDTYLDILPKLKPKKAKEPRPVKPLPKPKSQSGPPVPAPFPAPAPAPVPASRTNVLPRASFGPAPKGLLKTSKPKAKAGVAVMDRE